MVGRGTLSSTLHWAQIVSSNLHTHIPFVSTETLELLSYIKEKIDLLRERERPEQEGRRKKKERKGGREEEGGPCTLR